MKVPLAFLSAALLVSSRAADAPERSFVPDETLRSYQTMHKMTKQPRSVAPDFAALCASTLAGTTASRTGPHSGRWINVYMNEKAQTLFESKAKTAFPPGSIVVKEKLAAGQNPTIFTQESAPVVTAVAGLIKHPPGYNAKTDDWEFFYFEKDGKMERGAEGALSACADCHHGAVTDYVFGDFAKPASAR